MAEQKNYDGNDLKQLKRKILRIIDQDRNRAVRFLNTVNQQIQQQPQAVLLIGDKATQTLDNLRKHAGNMIKMYQVEKKKVTKNETPNDIQGMLAEIQREQKAKNAGKNPKEGSR